MRSLVTLVLGAALVWALPLVGLLLAGRPLAPFLQFPPRTSYVPHAAFDWAAFVLLSLPVLAAAWAIIWAMRRATVRAQPRAVGRLPWWTWLGLSGVAAGWFFAWDHGLGPSVWQRQSFTLLWFGFIVLLNALAYRRAGYSLLTHRTAWFSSLFPISAAFWWLFEYLNQFSANWNYGGVETGTPLDYFLHASLPFSTVLPAVASTWAWLRTFARLEALALPGLRMPRAAAWLGLLAGAAALAALPLWPEWLFPALWVAPLLVFAGIQQLLLGETLDWRSVLLPAIAALFCGFFWELWNYGAVIQWRYSVPLVQRFHIFEMPLLGYAGYLPFGVECALIMDLVARLVSRRRVTELL